MYNIYSKLLQQWYTEVTCLRIKTQPMFYFVLNGEKNKLYTPIIAYNNKKVLASGNNALVCLSLETSGSDVCTFARLQMCRHLSLHSQHFM